MTDYRCEEHNLYETFIYKNRDFLYISFVSFSRMLGAAKHIFVLQTSTTLLQKLSSFSIHTFCFGLVFLYTITLGCCNRMMSSAFTNCCFFFLQLDRLKQCLPALFFCFVLQTYDYNGYYYKQLR